MLEKGLIIFFEVVGSNPEKKLSVKGNDFDGVLSFQVGTPHLVGLEEFVHFHESVFAEFPFDNQDQLPFPAFCFDQVLELEVVGGSRWKGDCMIVGIILLPHSTDELRFDQNAQWKLFVTLNTRNVVVLIADKLGFQFLYKFFARGDI